MNIGDLRRCDLYQGLEVFVYVDGLAIFEECVFACGESVAACGKRGEFSEQGFCVFCCLQQLYDVPVALQLFLKIGV